MNRTTLLLVVLVIIGAIVVVHKNYDVTPLFKSTTNSIPQTVETSPSRTLTVYMPSPIDRSPLLSGKFSENDSPDGKFISHTFDNEQGDSGVYLTTSSGTEVTATYCGYFKEWSPDSKKIKVFVPYTCGKDVSENETFELNIDGTINR